MIRAAHRRAMSLRGGLDWSNAVESREVEDVLADAKHLIPHAVDASRLVGVARRRQSRLPPGVWSRCRRTGAPSPEDATAIMGQSSASPCRVATGNPATSGCRAAGPCVDDSPPPAATRIGSRQAIAGMTKRPSVPRARTPKMTQDAPRRARRSASSAPPECEPLRCVGSPEDECAD